LSSVVYGNEVLTAIREGRDPVSYGACWKARVRTDAGGVFSYVFPKRSYLHPVGVLFFIPLGAGSADDLILCAVSGGGKGEAYGIRVHKSRAHVFRIHSNEKTATGTSAKSKRGKNEDLIELTLVIRPTNEAK
jgi:hypothetical protein